MCDIHNILNQIVRSFSLGIVFSDNSELLGIAQSDNMVFVYRVGSDWSGKKVICNKFPLSGSPLHLLPAENGFCTGTSDGKIRYITLLINELNNKMKGQKSLLLGWNCIKL